MQAFYPLLMAAATMYHTTKNPLRKVSYKSAGVEAIKTPEQRKLHKALLRYHDHRNWQLIHDVLLRMGRADLIGSGEHQLIPKDQPEEGSAIRLTGARIHGLPTSGVPRARRF